MRPVKLPLMQMVVLFGLCGISLAQWQTLGSVTRVTPLPNGMELQAGQARVRFTALSSSVVRVRYAPHGSFPPEHSFAVLQQTGFSIPTVRVDIGADAAEFSTREVRVRVLKSPMRVVFLDPAGEIVFQEHPHHEVAWNGNEFRVSESMPGDEHYFGLGEKAGPLDRRNQAFTMWNTDAYGWQESTDPLYKDIPFFIGFRRGILTGCS